MVSYINFFLVFFFFLVHFSLFSYFLKGKIRSGAEGIGHAKAMTCIMNCGVTAETTIDIG